MVKGQFVDSAVPITSDVEQAQYFVQIFGRDLRWVPEWGVFVIWNGKVWRRVEQIFVIKNFLRIIRAPRADQNEKLQGLVDWPAIPTSYQAIKSMLHLVKAKLAIHHDRFDSHRHLLNVQNGILDLRTTRLFKHKRMAYCTNLTQAKFITSPKYPKRFVRALCAMVSLSAERLAKYGFRENYRRVLYLRRFFCSAFYGEVRDHIFHVLVGPGANGKSTIIELFTYICGTYASQISLKTLTSRRPSHNDLARLHGKRFVSSAETDQDQELNAATIKSLTGGDTISARFHYKEWFDFIPQATLILHTNHEPQVSDRSEGFWRRMRLIQCGQPIPAGKRERHLIETLKSDSDNIFSWIIRDAHKYNTEGFFVPKSITDDTIRYKEDSNPLRDLLEYFDVEPDRSKITEGHKYRTSAANIQFIYNGQRLASGNPEIKSKTLGRMLKDDGFLPGRATIGSKSRRCYFGLRPKSTAPSIEEMG
ncbi:MAG: hypothetical protein KF713_05740 [Turneriella sp.]|nr:hypothetical protein [Turneriella sp.]